MIGTVQVAGFALGFLFLSLYGGVLESLETLLFGSFLGITTDTGADAARDRGRHRWRFFARRRRPLLYSSVDELVAGARGVPVRARSRLPARARAGRRRDRADHRVSCSCSRSSSHQPLPRSS